MPLLAFEVMENFHVRLAELMAERNISDRHLAELLKSRGLDASHPTVGAWRKGERYPDLAEAAEIAAILGVSLAYLAYGEEPAATPQLTADEAWLLDTARKAGAARLTRRLIDLMLAEAGRPGEEADTVLESVTELPVRPRRSGHPKRDHKRADGKKGAAG